MPILCTICARGGSKGIKNKALKLINKKPLIYYTINQAFKSKIFDEVVVSTDSKKFKKYQIFGAKVGSCVQKIYLMITLQNYLSLRCIFKI